ncbi:uncharacterized protein Z518_10332 [Rhinocladiella mackenziei CBS 650.93]|uniref:Uncharacterized protein n=1 Tax=Rhinocladiella mackenziei CBS 650.93 TaxID=1442369 RepID=A0A0D2I335_9EURO|nr:uncharacterized protein Z518_10332 [Rhinocladiella mackenziei CBS 650.93]KIX00194.1 hypothetical protein Z518_10332 [Rhinocladiella mackenziei CBS 650.93]
MYHHDNKAITTLRPPEKTWGLANGTAARTRQECLPTNVVAVINTTIAAARASTMIMSAAARQNLFGEFCMIRDELIVMIIGSIPTASRMESTPSQPPRTLVMVNVALPYNEKNAAAIQSALSVAPRND